MKHLLSLFAATLCVSAAAQTTTIDTPAPVNCTWARTGGAPTTITGGTAAQCLSAAQAEPGAPLGVTNYTITDTATANVTRTVAPPPPPPGTSYTTTFQNLGPLAAPDWIGGRTVGLRWADVTVTTAGVAIGTQSGTGAEGNGQYNDSTAILAGTWGPNQTVVATVKATNQNKSGNIFEEVEIRLRSSMTANNSGGYECTFSNRTDAGAYIQINRWNGPANSFKELDGRGGTAYGLHNGDTIKCTASGSTITAYVNGVKKLSVVDTTFPTGSPGIGMFLQNPTSQTGLNPDYGITSVTATTD